MIRRMGLVTGLVFLVIFIAAGSVAQNIDPLVTDRPDITESSAVVGKYVWQLETSVLFKRVDFADTETETWSFPTLFRFGFTRSFEFRLATDAYSTTSVELSGVPGGSTSGYAPVALGLKWHFMSGESNGLAPSMGLIVMALLPSGSAIFKLRNPETSAVLAADWDLSARFSFGANGGVDVFEDDDGTTRSSGLLTAALGYGVNDKLGLYVEFATSGTGLAPDKRLHVVDGGAVFLFTPNLQVDAALGYDINNVEDAGLFATLGFSYRGNFPVTGN